MFCAAIYTNLNPVILMGIWQFLKNNPIGWENETEDCVSRKQFWKTIRFRKLKKILKN